MLDDILYVSCVNEVFTANQYIINICVRYCWSTLISVWNSGAFATTKSIILP